MNWNFWKRPFSSYVFLWMALGLLSLTILLIAGALTSRDRDRWVSHTIEVIEYLERYESSILAVQVRLKSSDWSELSTNRKEADADLANAQQSLAHLLELTDDELRTSSPFG